MFLNSSLVELQFLPQLKPIEIITQQCGRSWRGTAAKNRSPRQPLFMVTWSVVFIIHTKKDGSKRDWLTSVLVNSFRGRVNVCFMSTFSEKAREIHSSVCGKLIDHLNKQQQMQVKKFIIHNATKESPCVKGMGLGEHRWPG